MELIAQQIVNGLSAGMAYALVALGFVLIFRATNVVNFAQGEFSMVAAFLMVVFAVDLQWPYWLSFLISVGGMALFGVIFNLGVYYPLRHRTFLPVIIATIGASIFLANSVLANSNTGSDLVVHNFTTGVGAATVKVDANPLLFAKADLVAALKNWLSYLTQERRAAKLTVEAYQRDVGDFLRAGDRLLGRCR